MPATFNKRWSGMVAKLGWGLALLFLASCLHCSASTIVETDHPQYARLTANTSLAFYLIDSLCALPPYIFTTRFNMTHLDPQTGVQQSVYTSEDTCQLFEPVAPVGDPRTKRAFVCAYYRSEWYELWGEPMLTIYDLSNPSKALPQQRIPLPIGPDELTVYLYSNQIYDAATESVWVMCSSFDGDDRHVSTFMVKIDLVKGVAYNITEVLVPKPVPVQISNLGNGVFNAKTRSMWFPVIAGPAGSQHVLVEFNVDEAKFVNFFQTNYTVNSMIWDSTTNTIYGFLNGGFSLSYGVLQPESGEWTILQEYSNVYDAGKVVLDPSTGLIYGMVDGFNQLQFITFDLKTGAVRSVKNLPQSANPNLLFVV